MKQMLKDYGVELTRIPLLCDNESAVKLANNPIFAITSLGTTSQRETSSCEMWELRSNWRTSSLSH
ncbi:hypothetical protein U9M48_013500 [Paspalum notatum var. saurae]|uniref:Uncharacterized protein n=1 Tax=Paspalum notatum var. saurae TaxID=547442 RepID=A0AAQ3WJE3_PASNO